MTFVKGKPPWNKGLRGYNPPGRASFPKGHTPWNKGTRGYTTANRTSFKPGARPTKQLAIGTVTRRRTKRGVIRQFIKVETGWVELAKYLWIQEYGCFIPGDVTHHLNGNCLDDYIENLVAMPRALHPVFHSKWGLTLIPTDLLNSLRERYLAEARLRQDNPMAVLL